MDEDLNGLNELFSVLFVPVAKLISLLRYAEKSYMAASLAAPLTSPHGCDGCLQKFQSIADLERRISDLYWIQNEEKLLDSVVKLGAGLPANSAELDLTISATDVDPIHEALEA